MSFNNIDDFVPYTSSIYEICKIVNKPEYFAQIRNRILREMEENESVGDYIRIDPSNPDDICLDDDGIFIFSEILMCYFDENLVRDLWKYVRELNKHQRILYEFDISIRSSTVKQLKTMLEKYVAYIPKSEGEEEAKKEVLNKIKIELNNRKIIRGSKESNITKKRIGGE